VWIAHAVVDGSKGWIDLVRIRRGKRIGKGIRRRRRYRKEKKKWEKGYLGNIKKNQIKLK
jgi:hypothetical protein